MDDDQRGERRAVVSSAAPAPASRQHDRAHAGTSSAKRLHLICARHQLCQPYSASLWPIPCPCTAAAQPRRHPARRDWSTGPPPITRQYRRRGLDQRESPLLATNATTRDELPRPGSVCLKHFPRSPRPSRNWQTEPSFALRPLRRLIFVHSHRPSAPVCHGPSRPPFPGDTISIT